MRGMNVAMGKTAAMRIDSNGMPTAIVVLLMLYNGGSDGTESARTTTMSDEPVRH